MKKSFNLFTGLQGHKSFRNLALVAFSFFAWGIGEGLFFYFQPIYMQELGASPMVIGTILGLNGLAMTLVQAPAGYLADKWGSRTVMLISWIVATLATVVMAFSSTLFGFTIGWILYGLSATSAATSSYITNVRGHLSVSRALTIVSSLYHIGAFMGPFAGGEIAQALGLQVIYRISIVFFIASTFIIFFTRSDRATATHQPRREAHPLRYRPFLVLLGLSFITIFSGYLAEPLTPNFLQGTHQLSLAEIGILGSVGSLGNAVISLAFGGFSPFMGIIIGHSLLALFSVSMWQGTGMVWFAFGFFFRGGYRIFQAMYMAAARDLLPSSEMGLAYGLMGTANSIAVILAPPAAGLIYQSSPSLIYPVSLSLLLATLIINFLVSRYLKNRGQERNRARLEEHA